MPGKRQEIEPGIASPHVTQQLEILISRAEKNFPGTTYAVFFNHAVGQLDYAPPALILSSPFSHAIDYASGVFEGISAHVNQRTGVPHVILLDPRTERMFTRSIPSSALTSPITPQEFRQAVVDFVAVNGQNNQLFQNPKNPDELVRAYIRPTIHPAPLGGYGVWLQEGYPTDAAFITWPWPDYLPPTTYTEGGEVAITGKQRLSNITGKHARNYGEAVVDSKVARERFGVKEFVYLAPYLIDHDGSIVWENPKNTPRFMKDGALADGPGEEVFAITSDMKTMVYPPMDVNRLGGTTLEYVKHHIAPRFGIEAQEKNITLRDLRDGKYAALAFAGNAVRIAPIRLIRIINTPPGADYGSVNEEIELFKPGDIPNPLRQIMNRWEDKINGRVDPSHPSLVTPIDMERGKNIREQLDHTFAQKPTLSHSATASLHT